MINKEIINTAAKPDSVFRSLLLVSPESNEWKYMWDRLAKHRLNIGLDNPSVAEFYGETWQYMESVKTRFGYKHLFRHRLHPRTESLECLSIWASLGLIIMPNESV